MYRGTAECRAQGEVHWAQSWFYSPHAWTCGTSPSYTWTCGTSPFTHLDLQAGLLHQQRWQLVHHPALSHHLHQKIPGWTGPSWFLIWVYPVSSCLLLRCCCSSRLLHRKWLMPPQSHRKRSGVPPALQRTWASSADGVCSYLFVYSCSVISPVQFIVQVNSQVHVRCHHLNVLCLDGHLYAWLSVPSSLVFPTLSWRWFHLVHFCTSHLPPLYIQGEQERGQDCSLWGPCTADYCVQHIVLSPHILWPVSEVIQDPGCEVLVYRCKTQIVSQTSAGCMVLKSLEKSKNMILTLLPGFSRWDSDLSKSRSDQVHVFGNIKIPQRRLWPLT